MECSSPDHIHDHIVRLAHDRKQGARTPARSPAIDELLYVASVCVVMAMREIGTPQPTRGRDLAQTYYSSHTYSKTYPVSVRWGNTTHKRNPHTTCMCSLPAV